MTTPRLLSERYELGGVLGYGGMSEVHRGLDTRLGRDVAIKVLRADLARDPQFQMRFRREAQNAAALNHPAIVAVYDTGVVQGESGSLPYIVMEYVDGQTLREIVTTTGPMTQERVIEVMADVCAALDFSHRHKIIHRDVKPANIMINRAGSVKVMDFGIARALGEGQNVTQTAAVIGTAQYLSPEQARGEAVDARSDVYAAGCVLFELLTGEPPFTGDSPVAVAYQHVREDPKHPSDVNPAIPAALDAVVLKALSKNPINRYQSAAEMRTDLVRVRSGQAPMAPVIMSEDERTAMYAVAPTTGATRRINGARHAVAPAPAHDDYYEDEPPRRTGRIVAMALAVLLALGVVGFVAFQIYRPAPSALPVEVPQLVDVDIQQARNQLIGLGLKAEERPVESALAQKDRVVSATPPAKSPVQKGTTIVLEVGTGPATAAVPALTGKTVSEATALLTERGLTLGQQTTEETSDAAKVDKILRSTPAAGEDAPGGSAVAVVVGIEQTTAEVPDVAGQSEDAAKARLEQAGFTVERQQVDSDDDPGTVLGTNPEAGTDVRKGSAVKLQISNGSQQQQQAQVPRVIGQTENAAKQILQAAGFNKIKVDKVQGDGNEFQESNGQVFRQSPDEGQNADLDSEVTIQVVEFNGGNGGGNSGFGFGDGNPFNN
ncbi:MAG: Stk1 family PASTA domain-containing Ser/Thr kinase [Pseudonocardia sp.]|nr:Stk1 family PASTA domain-containing Ser/Thr kinase [Pseudonocardia sp.]